MSGNVPDGVEELQVNTREVTELPSWRACLDDVTVSLSSITSISVLLQDAGVVSPLLHALDSVLSFLAGQKCVQVFDPLPHPAVNQTRPVQKLVRQPRLRREAWPRPGQHSVNHFLTTLTNEHKSFKHI